MIQSATAPRPPSPTDRSTDSRRSDAAGTFRQSLAAFLDARDGDDAPPVAAKPGNDDPAADGKPLPDQPAAPPTPPLAWLAQLAPTATTAPTAADARPQPPVAPAAILPPAAPALVAPMLVLASGAPPTTNAALVEANTAPVADAPPSESKRVEPKVDGFVLPAVPDPAPRGAAPAAEVFGAAIRAATGKDDDAAPRRDTADTGPLPVGAVGLEPQRHAVLATGDVQQAPLDTRHGNFPHQMIDRIEQLRDDANANDTRIRLIPDALGQIDVTMRRDGDAVHVHFAAEQGATRALLEDARPQLADLAAARGINLGQTSVGSDGGSQHRPQTPIPTPQPQRAATPTAAAAAPDDIRIA